MVRTTIWAATMVLVLGAGTIARAQSNCSNYGYLAMKQVRENEQRKCGNTGQRWTNDLKAHVAWCATVGPAEWKTELRERAKALAACQRR